MSTLIILHATTARGFHGVVMAVLGALKAHVTADATETANTSSSTRWIKRT